MRFNDSAILLTSLLSSSDATEAMPHPQCHFKKACQALGPNVSLSSPTAVLSKKFRQRTTKTASKSLSQTIYSSTFDSPYRHSFKMDGSQHVDEDPRRADGAQDVQNASPAVAAAAATAERARKAITAGGIITSYIMAEINDRWGYDPADKAKMIGVICSDAMMGLNKALNTYLFHHQAAGADAVGQICRTHLVRAGVDQGDADLMVGEVTGKSRASRCSNAMLGLNAALNAYLLRGNSAATTRF
ncbi:hypothetical protein GGTG_07133 [Gaeumannomyces tritici R3-111a-1]|uniref:Uncharacterized protein n=1 Tax=Gaeumannomyces tritici (strain R3-111a-1) TaxID=644352 RepID=J3P0T8_GAET3|nr:hypothetical protein GGTG_07133 [Gaeumannomyces tritici R3-111a-1]EJT77221.1 hypothetical protein GGTG_07133 [Gaeumannomyces tritici R3-111a-1]